MLATGRDMRAAYPWIEGVVTPLNARFAHVAWFRGSYQRPTGVGAETKHSE